MFRRLCAVIAVLLMIVGVGYTIGSLVGVYNATDSLNEVYRLTDPASHSALPVVDWLDNAVLYQGLGVLFLVGGMLIMWDVWVTRKR